VTYTCCYCGAESETVEDVHDHDCDEKPTVSSLGGERT